MSKPGSPTLGSLRANRPDGGRDHEESITSDEISDAAEALREVEIEAARDETDISIADNSIADNTDTVEWSNANAVEQEFVIPVNLEELSIDELRAVAGMLRIPNYPEITDQEELVAQIREYAEPVPRKPK
jgi:hypothetical protein